jgi:hypothetical protein
MPARRREKEHAGAHSVAPSVCRVCSFLHAPSSAGSELSLSSIFLQHAEDARGKRGEGHAGAGSVLSSGLHPHSFVCRSFVRPLFEHSGPPKRALRSPLEMGLLLSSLRQRGKWWHTPVGIGLLAILQRLNVRTHTALAAAGQVIRAEAN